MNGTLLVDAGPLVAVLAKRDQYHEWATSHAGNEPAPMLTTEPVLTEAAHLLRRHRLDPAILLQWVLRGALHVGLQLEAEAERIKQLMQTYADQPMSIADASLVRLSELHPQARVFTTDSDFSIYRRFGDQQIPLLMP